MPGKIKVKVLAGRNLPVMDRASDTTDAFVEIKFGSITHKTDVCRKSLNPHWNNTEWYRFEVDESELQDEPLQLRLMDHDTYSANDAIGKVVISLAPLLAREANNAKSTAAPHGGAVMSGWIPVFDTMHGIRGELNVIVKVELFSDFNKYKTSSCGVQFFHCPMIPPGYRATSIHGFVEELVVNDDPEYQWIDKIRTPRASNEARQVAFIKLSNQVQRLVGLKAAELGANAVVGYQQDFDLEGEAGVVARAIGTAVSITPLPMPSQPLNMPPCTQQQLKKYLDILATDNESTSEMSTYYQCHQDELQKLLLILNPNASSLLDETDALEEEEKSMDMTRQSSITSYAGSVSIYQDDLPHRRSLRHLSEDQTDLNKLLNKESDDSDSSGPIEKLKKIKTNFFTKRFTRRSSSKRSSIDKQDDSISLRSTASDTSRISLVDIKNELKKFKGLRKPKFRKPFVNKEDEGEGMASILARSIIHVQTSLACIAETQDSEASPGSTMRRTSESEPNVNISDDEKTKANKEIESEQAKKMPEIRFTSLNNISTEEITVPQRERKISDSCPATPMPDRSENLLTLPGEEGYFGSISSALSADSSELESSSEEDDDESSDLKTDNERTIETTSSVVQSVLSHDINPQFIASMDKKLNVLESGSQDIKEVKPMDTKKEIDKKAVVEQEVFDTQVLIDKCKSLECVPREMESEIVAEKPVRSNEASTSSVKDETCVTKPSSQSHHIKFHNPFSQKKPAKSISEPSSPVDKGSFVHRSSRRIRRQLSKLSKSNMIKSISHYSLHPKKKETKTPLSQPGSSSDVRSKAPSDTVLGSPFLSFNDLMSLDKESIDTNKFFHKSDDFDHVKVSMYIGSEPVSRSSLSGISSPYHREEPHHHEKKHSIKSTGMVHTAMETILLDKVQSLLMPASPDPDSVKNKQFFDDVNEKLGLVEEYRNNNNNASVGSSINLMPSHRPQSQSPPVSNKPVVVSGIRKEKIHEHKSKPPSLMQTAMETMLMDQVQSVLMSTTPEPSQPEFRFEGNELPESHEQHKNIARKSISYIQSLLGPKSPDHTSPTERFFDSKKKREPMSTGLVHTAMETMLMEKVQSVLGPETPEPVSSVFDYYDRPEEYDHHHKKDDRPHSLFQTAVETMLLEKVQASALGGSVPDPVISTDEESYHELHKTDSSTGMTHSAMETMLMDRITSLVGQSDVPHVNPHHSDEDESEKHDKKSIKDDLKPTGLIHTAFETMLLEKVQASALGGSIPNPVISTEEEKNRELHKTDSSTGMTHSAIETMLMDRITSLVGQPDIPHVNPHRSDDDESEKRDRKSIKDDLKPTGLIHTAFETMLLEKVQASALGGSVPNPVISTEEEKYHEMHKTDSSSGMTHSAMETILMDKITSLVGQPDVPHVEAHITEEESEKLDKKSIKDDLKPTGLIHTAVETILLDKVQASALGTPVPDPVIPTEDDHNLKSHEKQEIGGLTHTAMETILMDKVQSLVGQQEITFVEPKTFSEDELEKAEHLNNDLKSPGLVKSVVNNILLDKVHTLADEKEIAVEKLKEIFDKTHSTENLKSSGLVHTAFETVLLDKVQTLIPSGAETADNKNKVDEVEHDEPPGIISTVIDKIQSLLPTIEVGTTEETKTIEKPEAKQNNKKLTRQDSVHSITENETPKMSKKSNKSSSDVTKPVVLIHGALETIPSLPETQDDVDKTNNSVCDNSHAVCGVNRNERERDRREEKCDKDRGSPRHARHESYGGKEPAQTAHAQNSSLNATSAPLGIHRRSSDSDLSVTPKGGSLNTSAGNVGSGGGAILRPSMNSNNLDMLEYPFLTMTEYAPGFIVHIGGTVCARSVKLADGGEGAARAAWWAELRTELRAHARALRCNAVIAYTENTAICEDVCVLSASGTAAVINLDCDFNAELEPSTATIGSKNGIDDLESELCSMAHVPYSPGAGPYRAELSTCGGCRRARVPTVLLATCSKPSRLTSHAKAVTLTAVAARVRRAPPTSEPGARDISDQLPFLEYELHKLLLAKLRMQGANALFSLQTQISIGERCVMALASGTACRLGALPPPAPPRIKASENDKDALEIQKALWDSFSANRAANGFDIGGIEHATNGVLPEVEGEEAPVLDLCADKDACVLELDEAEDVETARALAKRHVNMQVYTHGLKPVMGAQPQAFAQVWRGRLVLSGGAGSAAVERHVRRALDGVAYKLRRLQPCALVAPRLQLELPEDEIQLIVSGSAIPLQDPTSPEVNGVEHQSRSNSQHSSQHSGHSSAASSQAGSQAGQGNGTGDADDDIFTLDEEQLGKSPPEVVEEKGFVNGQVPTTVSLTTLSHISGGRVSRRLCALRLLFVRETTAVRELGGLSGFLHTFTCEVMAIVRAYTAALGGNALTSFYITQLMLQDNAHKNQGQCLLSVGGDIVHITY